MNLEGEKGHLISLLESASIQSALRKPDSIFIDEPSCLQIITPSMKYSRFNSVLRSRFSEGGSKDVDLGVQKIMKRYEVRGLPFQWEVGPRTRPFDLGDRLLKLGFRAKPEVLGMALNLDRFSLPWRPGIAVREISKTEVDDWVGVSIMGWTLPKNLDWSLREDLLRDLDQPKKEIFYFLAYHEGRPAGAAALRLVEDSGYLQGSTVVPEFRGRGVYQDLVAHRLQVLRQLKIQWAITQCFKNTSAPILQKMGFGGVCAIHTYEHDRDP